MAPPRPSPAPSRPGRPGQRALPAAGRPRRRRLLRRLTSDPPLTPPPPPREGEGGEWGLCSRPRWTTRPARAAQPRTPSPLAGMGMLRLVASDIDGTLVRADKTVSDRTRRALRADPGGRRRRRAGDGAAGPHRRSIGARHRRLRPAALLQRRRRLRPRPAGDRAPHPARRRDRPAPDRGAARGRARRSASPSSRGGASPASRPTS